MTVEKITANIADAKNLLKELSSLVEDSFTVKSSSLPEHLRGKRKTQKLSSLKRATASAKAARDPRDVSVKFDNKQNIVGGTPERLASIARYRLQAETGEIQFDVNDDRLYANQMAFAKIVLSEEDFED